MSSIYEPVAIHLLAAIKYISTATKFIPDQYVFSSHS